MERYKGKSQLLGYSGKGGSLLASADCTTQTGGCLLCGPKYLATGLAEWEEDSVSPDLQKYELGEEQCFTWRLNH